MKHALQKLKAPPLPGRGLQVLIAQIAVLLLVPLADTGEERVNATAVIVAVSLATFATWSVAGRAWGITLMILSGSAVLAGLIARASDSANVRFFAGFDLVIAYLVATYAVGRAAFSPRLQGTERIYCGIASFILFAFAFAVLHERVSHWSPGAYALNDSIEGKRGTHWSDFLWLSFSTITTSGFADTTPVSPWARVVASLEGLVGILYPATFIARVVSLPPDEKALV
ncbi:MAG: potassium channel family protein [Phycisphaerales bacterium]